MRVSSEIKALPGVEQAFAFMATEVNIKTRIQESLMDEEVTSASADDLVLLVEAVDETMGQFALEEFERMIVSSASSNQQNTDSDAKTPSTIEQGLSKVDANIAIVSVPGPYATVQALNALNNNLNVMLFSDNVSVDDEVMLKDYAKERGLIVMGPDCGTAIINGTPLCFANVVKTGSVGIIGASGTGTQELTVLLDIKNCGISHAIGTGGRDLSEQVAARTTLAALELLKDDDNTKIISIISKPPAQSVADYISDQVQTIGKPVVLAYLGASSRQVSENVFIAGTIEEAAAKICAIYNNENPTNAKYIFERTDFPSSLNVRLSSNQKKIVGLYTGGTLASEAKHILKGLNAEISDLGDDQYTRGALHPMIDPSVRSEYISKAFLDEEVAIILCDVVIGFGSHENPASVLVKAVQAAKLKTNLNKVVITSVTGTNNDPQIKDDQVEILKQADILVFPSNQYAVEMAAHMIAQIEE